MNESIQLYTILDRALGIGRTRASGTQRGESEGNVTGLISAEFCEIRSRKLAVEESVKLLVLRSNLTVWNLRLIRLSKACEKLISMHLDAIRVFKDIPSFEVAAQKSAPVESFQHHFPTFLRGQSSRQPSFAGRKRLQLRGGS